jgi:TfoX/Sxy family transcriptional regulator of competence genes
MTGLVVSKLKERSSMPYDEGLAERIRDLFDGREDVVEKKMFGGLAFMINGNMCCGVSKEDLMLRLGADGAKAALEHPCARDMDFTGKPLKGFVYVDAHGYAEDEDLENWIQRAAKFAASLPAK